MTDKEKYRKFCETEKTIPIFSRDWWLDAACGKDHWDVILIEQNNKILAALPIYIPIAKIISMPSYTQTMGPWIAPASPDTKYTTELGRRQELCKQFTEKLTTYRCFLQNFNYNITDWLPFYWAGFQQTTRYTYLLKAIGNKQAVWENMSPNIRRNIHKAHDKFHLTVKKGITVKEFLNAQTQTFERQNIKNKSNTRTLKKLIALCKEKGQGDLWGAYDEEGRLHSAAFVVWQEQSAYYLGGGSISEFRNSGAQSLVLWECIQYVSQFTSAFDFEGSMLPGVERFFREFGAIQMPYFTITRGKLSLIDRARIKLSNWI